MAKMIQVPYEFKTSRYFTNADNANLIYFQFPKLLMYGEKYKKMSGDSKLFYMICLDLIKLSMQKDWKDEYGHYYIKMSLDTIKIRMNCAKTKAVNLKKELEQYGLLEERRMGQGKANRLYILQLEYTDDDIYKANNDHEDIENDEDILSDELGALEPHKKSQKQTSRSLKNRPLEVSKTDPIKNLSIKNNSIKSFDDDKKRTSPNQTDESINLLISNFRDATKDDITNRSFKAVVRKVIDKYNQGKVNSLRDYLATALANKIDELELRRAKDEAKEKLKAGSQERIQQKKQQLEQQPIRNTVPFYNWLED